MSQADQESFTMPVIVAVPEVGAIAYSSQTRLPSPLPGFFVYEYLCWNVIPGEVIDCRKPA
jgi:hypothetical protein